MPGRNQSGQTDPSFRRTGDSFDLKNIRAYGAGDDVRHIDWKLYGRTKRLYIKEFFADHHDGLCVLLDVSDSMLVFDNLAMNRGVSNTRDTVALRDFLTSRRNAAVQGTSGEPGGDFSLRVAASIAWMTASLGIPTELMSFADKILAIMQPMRAPPSPAHVSRFVSGLVRGGKTDLSRSIREAKSLSSHRKVLVISDFLDRGFKFSSCPFFQINTIRLHGDFRHASVSVPEAEILDPETRTRIRISIDKPLLDECAFRDAALDTFLKASWSRKLNIGDSRLPVYRAFLEAILV